MLGLELGEHEGILRLYNPTTPQWLQPPEERAEQAEAELKASARRHNLILKGNLLNLYNL